MNKNSTWQFFASVKLALAVLIFLAAISIIGTFVKQGQEPTWYVQEYGENLAKFFTTSDITNMYSSWWFVTLLCLFAINLVVCSIERLPGVWQQMVRDNLDVETSQLARMSFTHRADTGLSVAAAAATMDQVFKRAGWGNLRQAERDESILLGGQKGAWTRLGVYVVHLSILVILVGAIIGSIFGFQAYVFIPEGQATSNVFLRKTKEPLSMGFELYCERSEKTYYPNGMVRQYHADLAVLDKEGEDPYRKSIVVNDPLSYGGLTFYLGDSYPMDAFFLEVRNQRTGQEQLFRIPAQQDVVWQGTDVSFRIEELNHDQDGAVQLAKIRFVSGSAEPSVLWVRNKNSVTIRQPTGDYVLSFRQLHSILLLVTKDPGLWVVFSGFVLMVVGLAISFFLSHRRIWVHILPSGKQGSRILVAGVSNKHKPAFENQFRKVVEHIDDGIRPVSGRECNQRKINPN
jgi:cytochrome c biogenesis protein